MSAFCGQGMESTGTLDCSPPGSSVHGIFQARILEGILQGIFLQGIFPTQGSNLWLLRCRWILYPLSHQTELNETLSSASPWPQMNVIRCDRCHGNPGEGDKDGQLRGNDFVVFSHFVSRPLCSRYRWLPSRRGGVSGFGVPPASMRRAADQNGGGGRHNWGQGFRLGDQWRSGLCLPTSLSTQMTFPPSSGWPSPLSSSWCCWIWPTLNVVFQNKTTVF